MGKYSFGNTSKSRRDTCHPKWRIILNEAIKTAPFDFGIVCGFRGKTMQNKAYNEGKSSAKWGESTHNYRIGDKPCSLSVDVAPYDQEAQDYIWDDKAKFRKLFEHIRMIAYKHGINVRWGGSFKSFTDMPHIEFVI